MLSQQWNASINFMHNPPQWFIQAINAPSTAKHVISDNCPIEYLLWGNTDNPLLLLIHGNGGHANWWDFIAPSFMEDYCVCAVHLAGMGDSGHKPEYHFDSFAQDIIAVAQDIGHTDQITLIGHSMGGIIAMRTAENYPRQIQHLIIIDTPLIFKHSNDPIDDHKPPAPTHHKFTGKKYYPDFETALRRFRLVPPQACKNDFLVEHVGRLSIRQFEQGWSWKFDDGIYFNLKRTPNRPVFDIEKIQCSLVYFYADDSALVPQNILPDIHQLLKNKGPVIKIKNSHHHVLLDEPLQLIEKIKQQLI